MSDSPPEDGWQHVGQDEEGTPLFIDLKSIRTRGGVRLDRLEVTVVTKPARGSSAFRALEELLFKAGKACDGAAYVEQYWVLLLPKKLFGIRRLTVKKTDGAILHSVPLSEMDLGTIERGSAAERVSRAVESFLQDQSLVLQMPDVGLPARPVRSRTSPTASLRRDVINLDTPRNRTGRTGRAVRRVGSTGVWARLLRHLRKKP